MDLTTLTALLSTTAGKAVAGFTIAATGVGGLHAADVVDLPSATTDGGAEVIDDSELVDEPLTEAPTPDGDDVADPELDPTPTDEDGDDGATGDGDDADPADDVADGPEGDESDVADGDADAEVGVQSRMSDDGEELPGVDGASVSATARAEGGVDGRAVSEAARAGTPSADRPHPHHDRDEPPEEGTDEGSDEAETPDAPEQPAADDDDQGQAPAPQANAAASGRGKAHGRS